MSCVTGLNSRLHSTLEEGVHSQVRLCWLSPMREPYANIKNSALSYTSNSRILVPSWSAWRKPPSSSHLPATTFLGPSRKPEDTGTPPFSAPKPECYSYVKWGWRRKTVPVSSPFPWTEMVFKPLNMPFPMCMLTGPVGWDRLKIKSEVWNGIANLHLLLSECCMAAWMTDFFQGCVLAGALFFQVCHKECAGLVS